MATRTKTYPSSPGFIIDPKSIVRNGGRQVDFALVPAGATYGAAGSKSLKAGTIVSEVTATGKIVPRALALAGTTTLGILETAAGESSESDSLSGYGVIRGGGIYSNRLPDAADAAFATMQTELGARFYFETTADSRAA